MVEQVRMDGAGMGGMKNVKDQYGKSGPVLEELRIPTQVKLAGLWATLMFFYLYADVLAFYQPGTLEEIIKGEVAGMQISQAFSFEAAIVMAIPSVMVFLSLTLKAKANRWANIISGIYSAVVLLTSVMLAGFSAYYVFVYVIGEAVLFALIVWHAWKWPSVSRNSAAGN